MRDTIKLASLSKIYTNHDVRAIAITLWYDAQVQVNLRPSCSSCLMRALQQNISQSRLLYFLSSKSQYAECGFPRSLWNYPEE